MSFLILFSIYEAKWPVVKKTGKKKEMLKFEYLENEKIFLDEMSYKKL